MLPPGHMAAFKEVCPMFDPKMAKGVSNKKGITVGLWLSF